MGENWITEKADAATFSIILLVNIEDLGSVTTLLSRRFLVKQYIQYHSIQYLTIYDNICWHIGKTKASGCACWSLLPCPMGQFRFASCVLVILNWSSVVFCGFGSSGTLLQLGFPPHPLLSACVWVHARERKGKRERERERITGPSQVLVSLVGLASLVNLVSWVRIFRISVAAACIFPFLHFSIACGPRFSPLRWLQSGFSQRRSETICAGDRKLLFSRDILKVFQGRVATEGQEVGVQ